MATGDLPRLVRHGDNLVIVEEGLPYIKPVPKGSTFEMMFRFGITECWVTLPGNLRVSTITELSRTEITECLRRHPMPSKDEPTKDGLPHNSYDLDFTNWVHRKGFIGNVNDLIDVVNTQSKQITELTQRITQLEGEVSQMDDVFIRRIGS